MTIGFGIHFLYVCGIFNYSPQDMQVTVVLIYRWIHQDRTTKVRRLCEQTMQWGTCIFLLRICIYHERKNGTTPILHVGKSRNFQTRRGQMGTKHTHAKKIHFKTIDSCRGCRKGEGVRVGRGRPWEPLRSIAKWSATARGWTKRGRRRTHARWLRPS